MSMVSEALRNEETRAGALAPQKQGGHLNRASFAYQNGGNRSAVTLLV